MTCREKLKLEHPEAVSDLLWGGCMGCPSSYDYLDNPEICSKELLDVEYPPLNDSFQNYKNDMLDSFKEYTQAKVKEFDKMIFNELKKYGIEDLKDFSRVQAVLQMTRNEGIEVESKWYVDGEHVFDLCKRTSQMYKSGMTYEFQVEYFIRKDAI